MDFPCVTSIKPIEYGLARPTKEREHYEARKEILTPPCKLMGKGRWLEIVSWNRPTTQGGDILNKPPIVAPVIPPATVLARTDSSGVGLWR